MSRRTWNNAPALLLIGLLVGEPVALGVESDLPGSTGSAPETMQPEETTLRLELAQAERAHDLNILSSRMRLGLFLWRRGQSAEARSLFERVREVADTQVRPDESARVLATGFLAVLDYEEGNLSAARRLAQEAVPLVSQLSQKSDVSQLAVELGRMLISDGAPSKAEPLLRYAYAFDSNAAAAVHSEQSSADLTRLHSRAALELARWSAGELRGQKATDLLAESITTLSTLGSAETQDLARQRLAFGDILIAARLYGNAEHHLRTAIELYSHVPINMRAGEIDCWAALGHLYMRQQQWSEAQEAYTQALALRQKRSGENHWQAALLKYRVGYTLLTLKDSASALPLLDSSVKWFTQNVGSEDVYTSYARYGLALAYYTSAQEGEAEPLLVKSVEAQRSHPQDHELEGAALVLGEIRAANGRKAEALELYELSWKGYERRSEPSSDYVRSAMRLGQLRLEYSNLPGAQEVLERAYAHRDLAEPADRALTVYLLRSTHLQQRDGVDVADYDRELRRVCGGRPPDLYTTQVCAVMVQDVEMR